MDILTKGTVRALGLTLIAAGSILASSCAITDAFSTGDRDGDLPSPTATPAAESAGVARGSSGSQHRFFVTPPTDYDPDVVDDSASLEVRHLEAVADAWSETNTVHFELDIDGRTVLDADGNIELRSAGGDLKRPDMAQAEANVGVSFARFDVGLIIIGDEAYMTNFLTGDWERASSDFDFNPALIFDDQNGIGAVLEDMDDPQIGDEATINGRDTIEIAGTVPRENVSRLVAGTLEGDEFDVRIWFDQGTSDLLRISITEPEEANDDPTTWIITFSDHGSPVSIEAPDL